MKSRGVARLFRVVMASGAAAAGAVLLASGCRDATQVTLDIRMSDRAQCTEIQGTAITVGVEPVDTEKRVQENYLTAATRACDPATRAIGTLVVTPGDEGRASVVVAVAYDKSLASGEACKPPLYKGCIVARRRFSFADHKALMMPITLDPECKDVPCEAFSTCRQGLCIDSTVDTSESGGGGGVVTEPGQTPDGGTDPGKVVDGSVPDAPIDVGDAGLDGPLPDGPVAIEGGLDGGVGGTVPYCSLDVPPLKCMLSAGIPTSCGALQACCGAVDATCASVCAAPGLQRCCTSTDCANSGCCERPDAGNGAGFCRPKAATNDGGSVPFIQCADDMK